MPPSRSGKSLGISVKSSLRTLQILEYIDSKQRAVTIAELSDSLDFPQSSTSTLVQSMINAGYLVVDHDGRSILPSSRVAAFPNPFSRAMSNAATARPDPIWSPPLVDGGGDAEDTQDHADE